MFEKMRESGGKGAAEDAEETPETILLRLSDPAIQYAFQRLRRFRREAELGTDLGDQTCPWEEHLRGLYGGDAELEAAYAEYVALKNFREDGQIVIEEEKIVEAY